MIKKCKYCKRIMIGKSRWTYGGPDGEPICTKCVIDITQATVRNIYELREWYSEAKELLETSKQLLERAEERNDQVSRLIKESEDGDASND